MVGSADIERKLGELRAKLHDYELKAKQIPHIKKEIADLEEELESENFHNPEGQKSVKKDLPEAPMPPMAQPAEALPEDAAKKRMKAINKKLKQIQELKEKDGGELNADAIAKINGEPKLLKELECLKNGEPYVSDNEDAPVTFKALANDPAEAEKRIKALSKKIQQIEGLKDKAKGGDLDAEAKAKIASERQLRQELEALQNGATTVVFAEPGLDEILEKQTAEKSELERRHKAIKKKLTAIATLKKKDILDDDGKAKLATEKDLKKELSTVEKSIGEINKNERARVEERLG